jgi:hypothetical protein
MRQVFSSSRLENVEGVAQLLREAGVEIKVTDDRSYRKVSRREFSYVPSQQAAQSSPQPAVWVLNSDDYKRARELLAEGGLLDEAKTGASYLPETLQVAPRPAAAPEARIGRVRMALLFIVGALVLWTILRITVLG